VHGARVLAVAGGPPALSGPEGDAIVTDRAGAAVTVRTADCLPILLSADGGRVVGAVHAGWRGTLAGVAAAAVRTLSARYGVAPDDVTAVLGPCIRACCYEVGPDVTDRVRQVHPAWADAVLAPGPDGREHLDLAALNHLQLSACGVADVRDTGACTCCDAASYPSYRRDGANAGRLASWIRAAPSGRR